MVPRGKGRPPQRTHRVIILHVTECDPLYFEMRQALTEALLPIVVWCESC